MFEVENLSVQIEGADIINDLSFNINPGTVNAIMGVNGSGKSTLANVIAGNPQYEVTSGSIKFNKRELLDLEPEERAGEGIFLAFQYPVELPGVLTSYFLRTAYNALRKYRGLEELKLRDFQKLVKEKCELLDFPPELTKRAVNEGFSGGEKKRHEILQMLLFEPKFVILDETDSGLDIDALQVVAKGVNELKKSNPKTSFLIITHYQRLLNYIEPDVVNVMIDGKIVESGDKNLALKLENEGYGWVKDKLQASC